MMRAFERGAARVRQCLSAGTRVGVTTRHYSTGDVPRVTRTQWPLPTALRCTGGGCGRDSRAIVEQTWTRGLHDASGNQATPEAQEATGSTSATAPSAATPYGGLKKEFKTEVHETLCRDLRAMGDELRVVMVGSSHAGRFTYIKSAIKLWAQSQDDGVQFCDARKTFIAGIGGDTTQNVLWRLENGLLDALRARESSDLVIPVVVGGNNLRRKGVVPGQVVEDQKEIKRRLDPFGQVFFFQPINETTLNKNELWQEYVEAANLQWGEEHLSLIWSQEWFERDRVHLNVRGNTELLRVLNEKLQSYQ